MTFADWVRDTREEFAEHDPMTATRRSAGAFGLGILRRVGRNVNYGRPIWSREWDVLIVLDACRPDALAAVADSYPFLPDDVPTVYSNASMTLEWLEKNSRPEFEDELARTAYVTWNPFSEWVFDGPEWAVLDEVWRGVWDDELGVVPPRPVTDAAIRVGRQHAPERLIVHYMQPHAPYRSLDEVERLTHDQIGNLDNDRLTVWKLLDRGEMSHERAWSAYLDNLEWVLDDVALLLENLDADRAVLTADHGDAFGEWSCYGHPKYVPIPVLKRVPWVEVEAADRGTHEPGAAAESDHDVDVEGRLRALGYVDE